MKINVSILSSVAIAQRFNNHIRNFCYSRALCSKTGSRIMSLADPTQMSKSMKMKRQLFTSSRARSYPKKLPPLLQIPDLNQSPAKNLLNKPPTIPRHFLEKYSRTWRSFFRKRLRWSQNWTHKYYKRIPCTCSYPIKNLSRIKHTLNLFWWGCRSCTERA